MLLVITLFYAFGLLWSMLPVLLAVPFLFAALMIDWEHMILPDELNLALFILAVAHILLLEYESGWDSSMALDRVMAAVLLTTCLWLFSKIIGFWKKRQALGRGDLKFLPSAGLFIGLQALPSFLAVSGALGIATALLGLKNHPDQAFPFGPALII
ncbi:MAG: hypothetical protein DI551_11630, partial [Micavibrio aeruginosavorus]